MNERRFELCVSWVLLGFAVWYGAVMASYPDNAGRVPVVAASVMAGALAVQIVSLSRRRRETSDDEAPAPPVATVTAEQAEARTAGGGDDSHLDEKLNDELEKDSYDTLIALSGARLKRFLAIGAFVVAFYGAILLAGFVVTTGVLIAAILLTAREKIHTAVIAGLISAAAAYGLVVSLMGMKPWVGYLFGL